MLWMKWYNFIPSKKKKLDSHFLLGMTMGRDGDGFDSSIPMLTKSKVGSDIKDVELKFEYLSLRPVNNLLRYCL